MISESDTIDLFEKVKTYVNQNSEHWIESPRATAFGKGSTQRFIIEIKTSGKIQFIFDSGTTINLDYWRFLEAIKFIYTNESPVKIGALNTPNSLQSHISEIAKQRNKTKSDLRCAPHIADLLVLSGVAEYLYIKPNKGQRVQGIKAERTSRI